MAENPNIEIRRAVREFVAAATTGDRSRMWAQLQQLDYGSFD
jgi:hypothetical protein